MTNHDREIQCKIRVFQHVDKVDYASKSGQYLHWSDLALTDGDMRVKGIPRPVCAAAKLIQKTSTKHIGCECRKISSSSQPCCTNPRRELMYAKVGRHIDCILVNYKSQRIDVIRFSLIIFLNSMRICTS